jgi:signal transduction histidine kinase
VGQGTELGLAISDQVMLEKHNGRLWCDSELGQGTTFIIAIPIDQIEPEVALRVSLTPLIPVIESS